MRMHAGLALALLVVSACEDGSGVEKIKRIVDLSDGELDDLCDYVVSEQGTDVATCDDGEVTFPDHDECVDYFLGYSDDCTATVRQEEECAQKLGDDPCSDPAACHAADDC